MSQNYNGITAKLEDNIFIFNETDNHLDREQEEFILDFISDPDHYINFGTGLSLFLKEYGYNGDLEDTQNKITFLNAALAKQGLSIENKTLANWFTNKVRPMYKETQRESIYKICFALNLNENETTTFFNHIYFDRAFNFRNTRELVYYFCLKNHLSYEVATKIIDRIKKAEVNNILKEETVLTSHIYGSLDNLKTEEDIVDYVVNHPNNFSKYNVSAIKMLSASLQKLAGSIQDKEKIHQYRKSSLPIRAYKFHSLAVQEAYLEDLSLQVKLDDVYKADSLLMHKDVTSIDFLLSTIYRINLKKASLKNIKEQFERNHPLFIRQIADMLLLNFPDKKTFSNILASTQERHASYDAMRKAIILLHFYEFWCPLYMKENFNYDDLDFQPEYDDYIDEINTKLTYAGMGTLYVVNPYDRLFMICSTSDDPLMLFRSILGVIST